MDSIKPDPKYISIQVAATNHTDAGIEVVSETADPTHFSVYLRNFDGLAEHVVDFSCTRHRAMARSSALLAAAKLSMEHFIPIERLL
jgi:hypothetical protein